MKRFVMLIALFVFYANASEKNSTISGGSTPNEGSLSGAICAPSKSTEKENKRLVKFCQSYSVLADGIRQQETITQVFDKKSSSPIASLKYITRFDLSTEDFSSRVSQSADLISKRSLTSKQQTSFHLRHVLFMQAMQLAALSTINKINREKAANKEYIDIPRSFIECAGGFESEENIEDLF